MNSILIHQSNPLIVEESPIQRGISIVKCWADQVRALKTETLSSKEMKLSLITLRYFEGAGGFYKRIGMVRTEQGFSLPSVKPDPI